MVKKSFLLAVVFALLCHTAVSVCAVEGAPVVSSVSLGEAEFYRITGEPDAETAERVTLPAEGNIETRIEAYHYGDASETASATLIVATYDASGRLVGARAAQTAQLPGGTRQTLRERIAVQTGQTLRWFVWDDLASMRPLGNRAPSAPTGLVAEGTSNSTLRLSWEAASDDVGVAAYHIYRGDQRVGQTDDLSFDDVGLDYGTQYQYAVTAVDGAGLVSAKAAVSGRTLDVLSIRLQADKAEAGIGLVGGPEVADTDEKYYVFLDASDETNPTGENCALLIVGDKIPVTLKDAQLAETLAKAETVSLVVTYFDNDYGNKPLKVQLVDGQGTAHNDDFAIVGKGTDTWKKAVFTMPGLATANTLSAGMLRLNNQNGANNYVAKIELMPYAYVPKGAVLDINGALDNEYMTYLAPTDTGNDGYVTVQQMAGQQAIKVDIENGRKKLYLTVDDAYMTETDSHALLQITYYDGDTADSGTQGIVVQYQDAAAQEHELKIVRTGSRTWKTAEFELSDLSLRGGYAGSSKADFRINTNASASPIYISRVAVIKK